MKEKISINSESLNISIHEDEQFEEATISTQKNAMMDGLQENRELTGEKQLNAQEKLAEQISSDFATVKKENLVTPEGGSVPQEPKPVMVEKKVDALKTQDEQTYDSIVEAWENYLKTSEIKGDKYTPGKRVGELRDIVSKADSYSSWRFTFFMRASNPKYKRIMHAKEILTDARKELELQQQEASNLSAKAATGVNVNKVDYNFDPQLAGQLTAFNNAGVVKRAVARVTGTVHFVFGFLGKLLTKPFRKKADLNDHYKGAVELNDYWEAHANFLNRVFGESKTRTNDEGEKVTNKSTYSSRKTRETKETLKEDEIDAIYEDDAIVDLKIDRDKTIEVCDVAFDLANNILDELKKESPDMSKVKEMRKKLDEYKASIAKFNDDVRKDHPELLIPESEIEQIRKVEYQGQLAEVSKLDLYARDFPEEVTETEDWTQLKINEKHSIMNKEEFKKEWLLKGKMPDDFVEEKIKQAYRYTHNDEEIPKAELKKRKAEFQKKFDLLILMAKANRRHWIDLMDHGMKAKSEDANRLVKELKDTNLVRDMKVFMLIEPNKEILEKDYHEIASMNDRISDKKEANAARVQILKKYIDRYLNFNVNDMKEFEFKNDEELAVKYAMNSKWLASGFVAKNVLGSYKALGGTLTKEQETKFRMVQLFMEEFKVHAESVYKVKTSPFDMFMDGKYLDTLNHEQLGELKEMPGYDEELQDNKAGDAYEFYFQNRQNTIGNPFDGTDVVKQFEFNRTEAEEKTKKKK